MGRKPTKNLNLPSRMRARPKAGGIIWYYYDAGGKPRREIPLGSDYILAVKKWAELEADGQKRASQETTFPALWAKYAREVLPTLAASTQRVHQSDVKNLLAFFGQPPAPLEQIRPLHIRQFLEWLKAKPTTANRAKRLFSTLWNHARGWGWTDLQNPCQGIRGLTEGKRDVYVTDEIFRLVYQAASQPIKDAMDLAYLTGQRPGDVLKMTERDIQDNALPIHQGKTGARVRIKIEGALAEVLARIKTRKAGFKVWHAAILVGEHGKPLTVATLRNGFTDARNTAIAAHPDHADQIKAFWFRDLRAKAADDKADQAGESEAQKLLGHTDGRTTSKHYLRRGKLVGPTR
jgi:integrase